MTRLNPRLLAAGDGVVLVAEGAAVLGAADPGGDRDHAGLGVAELRRGGAGGDLRLLEGVGADLDLGARAAEHAAEHGALAGAAVARLHRHAVDVGGVLVGAAAADREQPAGPAGHHARLQRQDLVETVDREVLHHLAVEPLPGGHLVARHQRLGLADDRDLLDLDRRLLQLDVDGVGLAGQHLHAFDLGGLVADEGRAHRDRAGGHVVDEVVTLGIRERVERGPHDVHLGVRDRRAGLIAYPAFDLTSRALGEERSGSQAQRDCRVRESSRNACEGADTAMLHGYVLQRREPASTTDAERGARTLPLGSVACFGMRLLWEYTCIRRGARRRFRHRVRQPRPGQRCLIWSTENFMSSKRHGATCVDACRCNSLKPVRLPIETPIACLIRRAAAMTRRVREAFPARRTGVDDSNAD